MARRKIAEQGFFIPASNAPSNQTTSTTLTNTSLVTRQHRLSPTHSLTRLGHREMSTLSRPQNNEEAWWDIIFNPRPKLDMDSFEKENGIWIRTNNPNGKIKGVSLLTLPGLLNNPREGFVLIIPPKTPLPEDIDIIQTSDDHFVFAPIRDMKLEIYKERLARFAQNRCIPWGVHLPDRNFTIRLTSVLNSKLAEIIEKDPYFILGREKTRPFTAEMNRAF